MRTKPFPAYLLVLLPGLAIGCPAGDEPVFSCTTTRDKQINVCQAADAITYSFGRPGQGPELALREKNQTFDYRVSEGSGMEDHALRFKNGRTEYLLAVTTVLEREYSDGVSVNTTPFSQDATLVVRQGENIVANIECRSPTIKFNQRSILATRLPWE